MTLLRGKSWRVLRAFNPFMWLWWGAICLIELITIGPKRGRTWDR